MRYFKILDLCSDREISTVKVKALTLTNSGLSKNQRVKRAENIKKIIYSKSTEKMEFIDIKFVNFLYELDLL